MKKGRRNERASLPGWMKQTPGRGTSLETGRELLRTATLGSTNMGTIVVALAQPMGQWWSSAPSPTILGRRDASMGRLAQALSKDREQIEAAYVAGPNGCQLRRRLARLLRSGALTAVRVHDEAHRPPRDVVRVRDDPRTHGLLATHDLSRFLRPPVHMGGAWTERHQARLNTTTFRERGAKITFDNSLAIVLGAIELVRRHDPALLECGAARPRAELLVRGSTATTHCDAVAAPPAREYESDSRHCSLTSVVLSAPPSADQIPHISHLCSQRYPAALVNRAGVHPAPQGLLVGVGARGTACARTGAERNPYLREKALTAHSSGAGAARPSGESDRRYWHLRDAAREPA